MSTEKEVNLEKTNKQNVGLANIIVIIMSVVFVAMAALRLFVEGIETTYLCYAFCAAAIIVGIYMIVKYFMTDAYKNMNAYGFSIGTLLVILGICGMIRAAKMAEAFILILGIVLLLSGIIILQHALDLRRMADVMWTVALIIASLILICSIMVIIEPFEASIPYDVVVWWMLLAAGGLGIIINVYTMIRIKLFERKAQKNIDNNTVEAESQKEEETAVEETGSENEITGTAAEDTEQVEAIDNEV